MAFCWSDDLDAALIKARAEGKLGWRFCTPQGATVREAQKRYAFLNSGLERPAVKVGAPARGGSDPNEDGFSRLVRKGKLKGARLVMARHYRAIGRTAAMGEGAVKSCLDISVGGGQAGREPGGVAYEVTAAKRELFVMRFEVLRGQVDVLTALDGVLIGSHTTLALAGGVSSRSAELLQALYIGLDMLIAAAGERVKKAA